MSAASTDLNAAIPASKSATRLSFTMQCTVKSRVQDRCPDVTMHALRVVEIHVQRNAINVHKSDRTLPCGHLVVDLPC